MVKGAPSCSDDNLDCKYCTGIPFSILHLVNKKQAFWKVLRHVVNSPCDLGMLYLHLQYSWLRTQQCACTNTIDMICLTCICKSLVGSSTPVNLLHNSENANVRKRFTDFLFWKSQQYWHLKKTNTNYFLATLFMFYQVPPVASTAPPICYVCSYSHAHLCPSYITHTNNWNCRNYQARG